MRGGRGGRGACASRGPASGGCRARVEPRTPPEAEAAALEGVERRGPGDGLRRLNWRGYAAGKGGARPVWFAGAMEGGGSAWSPWSVSHPDARPRGDGRAAGRWEAAV